MFRGTSRQGETLGEEAVHRIFSEGSISLSNWSGITFTMFAVPRRTALPSPFIMAFVQWDSSMNQWTHMSGIGVGHIRIMIKNFVAAVKTRDLRFLRALPVDSRRSPRQTAAEAHCAGTRLRSGQRFPLWSPAKLESYPRGQC